MFDLLAQENLMQRKASKKTRAPNKAEREWLATVKAMPCCVCNAPPVSIADHIFGSAYKIKHNYESILVGPWMILPLCAEDDMIKNMGSHRKFVNTYGKHQVSYWLEMVQYYPQVPEEVVSAVRARQFH